MNNTTSRSEKVIKGVSYQCCFVRTCKNTTLKTPNKLFFKLPNGLERRNVWLTAVGRKPGELSATSCIHCCEDHFDLPNDVENWVKYNIMGAKVKKKLYKHVVPRQYPYNKDLKRANSPPPVTEKPSCSTMKTRVNEELQPSTLSAQIMQEQKEINDSKMKKIIPSNMCLKTEIDHDNSKDNDVDIPFKILQVYIKQEINEETQSNLSDEEIHNQTFSQHDISLDNQDIQSTKTYKHIKEETNIEEKQFSCNECQKIFTKKSSLYKHRQIHFRTEYSCDVCNRNYNHKDNLECHKRLHTSQNIFSCEFCDKVFCHKDYLDTHKTVHSMEKIFSCHLCQHTFNDQCELLQHNCINPSGKSNVFSDYLFSCEICFKSYRLRKSLSQHKRIHDGRRFSCEFCEKKFSRRDDLVVHKRTHRRNVLKTVVP